MMNDVIFNHNTNDPISMFDDWGLVLTKVENPLPTPKLVTVDIMGADGVIDLSEVATGELRYNNRTIKLTFEMLEVKNYNALITEIANRLHGKNVTLLFTNDEQYYYTGRATISDWECSKNQGTIVIDVDAYPYKLAVYETTLSYSIDGATTKYFNSDTTQTVCPKLEVTGTITIKVGEKTALYTAGTYVNNIILIKNGVNSIEFVEISNGTVKLTYRSGVF